MGKEFSRFRLCRPHAADAAEFSMRVRIHDKTLGLFWQPQGFSFLARKEKAA